jgi:hypothetical protein
MNCSALREIAGRLRVGALAPKRIGDSFSGGFGFTRLTDVVHHGSRTRPR